MQVETELDAIINAAVVPLATIRSGNLAADVVLAFLTQRGDEGGADPEAEAGDDEFGKAEEDEPELGDEEEGDSDG